MRRLHVALINTRRRQRVLIRMPIFEWVLCSNPLMMQYNVAGLL